MSKTLPTVDTDFIINKIIESGKVIPESKLVIGKTTTFVLKGDKPMHKRFAIVREVNGSVNFIQATGNALLFGFMGDLLEWYLENKNWKEGGYIVSKK